MILVKRFDTVRELQQINAKADTIMADLRVIKQLLEIDTTKNKRK